MEFISSLFRQNKTLPHLQAWQAINECHADNILERIREKLVIAAEQDSQYELFGANKHQYRLNPPIPADDVRQFQAETGCVFPQDYIDFITQLGNGGAGPYYGIKPFWSERDHNEAASCARPCLLRPDMDVEEWTALCRVPEDCSDEECDAIYARLHQGTFYLGTCGCEYDLLLVANGPYQGRILYTSHWYDSETPYWFSRETSFTQWYERWLDEVIQGYDTRWFGHRMGGDEATLLSLAENSGDAALIQDVMNALTKLPALSERGLSFLTQQLSSDDNGRYETALSVLAGFSAERALPYIRQAIAAPYDRRTDIAVSVIYFKYRGQYARFKAALAPVLNSPLSHRTLSYIRDILAD